jgi:hypothetical protein
MSSHRNGLLGFGVLKRAMSGGCTKRSREGLGLARAKVLSYWALFA